MALIADFFGPDYYEVVQDTPLVITPTATPTAIFSGRPYKWVLSYVIRLRTLGVTSTYVGVGDINAQAYRLTVVGQTLGYSANPKEIIDLSKIYLVSDAATAIVEVIVAYVPLPLQGSVMEATSRGMIS